MFNNTITLSNGVVVPQLAFGTWLIDNDKAADAVKSAIEALKNLEHIKDYGEHGFFTVFGGKM